MISSSHQPLFDRPNNIRRSFQVMKLLSDILHKDIYLDCRKATDKIIVFVFTPLDMRREVGRLSP